RDSGRSCNEESFDDAGGGSGRKRQTVPLATPRVRPSPSTGAGGAGESNDSRSALAARADGRSTGVWWGFGHLGYQYQPELPSAASEYGLSLVRVAARRFLARTSGPIATAYCQQDVTV